MGYTLTIGEARIEWDTERVCITCDAVTRDDAPAYGEPTDHQSTRWPSYSAWADSMQALGLMDAMFNENNGGKGFFEWNGEIRYPLIPSHPDAAPITREHVEIVAAKLAAYKAAHPDHIAQFRPLKLGAKPVAGAWYREEDYDDNPIYDCHLCRGEWLLYWLRWALDNCKQPVFVNT
jgi:hypothetical protein